MKEKTTQILIGSLVVLVLVLGVANLLKPVPKTEVLVTIPSVEVNFENPFDIQTSLSGTGDYFEVKYDLIGSSVATTSSNIINVGQIVYTPIYFSTTTATTSKYIQVPANADSFELNLLRNATVTDFTAGLGFLIEYDYERLGTTTNQLFAERVVSTSGTINTHSAASTTNIWTGELGEHGMTVEIPTNGARAMNITFFRNDKYANFELFANGFFHNDDK